MRRAGPTPLSQLRLNQFQALPQLRGHHLNGDVLRWGWNNKGEATDAAWKRVRRCGKIIRNLGTEGMRKKKSSFSGLALATR